MHPTESNLALYAGGELGFIARVQLARHLAGCEECQRQVEEFRAVREWVQAEHDLPPGVNWDRLAGELKANIRLGLAAGECVGPVRESVRIRWRAAAVALPVVLLVVTGWLLQSWHPPFGRPGFVDPGLAGPPVSRGLVLAATSSGVEVQEDGGALTLLHPRATGVSRSVNGDAVRTRYVDAETGYVTISHVYAQ